MVTPLIGKDSLVGQIVQGIQSGEFQQGLTAQGQPFSSMSNPATSPVYANLQGATGLPSALQESPIQQRETVPTVPRSNGKESKAKEPKAKEEKSYISQVNLKSHTGQFLTPVVMMNQSRKVSKDEFKAALTIYYRNHMQALQTGTFPTDRIGDIDIIPATQVKQGQPLEMAYQKHVRPGLEKAIEAPFNALTNLGVLPEGSGEFVSGLMPTQNIPQLTAEALTLGAGAGLATIPAAASFLGRTTQRGAAIGIPALGYGAAQYATGEQVEPTEMATIAGLNFVAHLISSNIGPKLAERAQKKSNDTIMGILERTHARGAVDVPVFRRRIGQDLTDLIKSGYDSLNDTLTESVDSIANVLHTTGGVSIFTRSQRDRMGTLLTDSIQAMRDFLGPSKKLGTIANLNTTLYRNLNELRDMTETALQNIGSDANRVSVVSNMINTTDRALRQQIIDRYFLRKATTPLEREIAAVYTSGRSSIDFGRLVRRTGSTRQAIDSALDRVWNRFVNDFSQDIMKQYNGILQRDLSGIALLDALKASTKSGRFEMADLQKHLIQNSQQLQSDLQSIGATVGGAFSSPQQAAQQLEQAAFRGGPRGVDVTRPRTTTQLPIPGLKIGKFNLGARIPLGTHTDFAGKPGVPNISPLPSLLPQAIMPMAIKGLTREE